jgi:hypothetical protein
MIAFVVRRIAVVLRVLVLMAGASSCANPSPAAAPTPNAPPERAATPSLDAGGHPVAEPGGNEPVKPGATPRVRIGPSMVSGRLPPEEIFGIVRRSYPALRDCYAAGLGRDPALTGKVVTHFTIGRDGAVSKASVEAGTTMPDQNVVACVRDTLGKLRFPAPDRGIVMVLLPILFEPG